MAIAFIPLDGRIRGVDSDMAQKYGNVLMF